MKFLYYLPAIGTPDIDKKLIILNNNLNYIYNNLKTKFSIIINCYNSYDLIKPFIEKYNFIDECFIYNKLGVLVF